MRDGWLSLNQGCYRNKQYPHAGLLRGKLVEAALAFRSTQKRTTLCCPAAFFACRADGILWHYQAMPRRPGELRSLLLSNPHRSLRALLPLLLGLACATALAAPDAAPKPPAQTLYNFSLVKPGGAVLPLASYKGKVVVIVNLASKSTFADQVPAFEKLEEKYKDQGLVVLGIPSNDFGAEEPGDDAQIQKFYAAQHVDFPVLAKSSVCGKDKLPVYGFLTAPPKGAKAKGPEAGSDVHWSFTKFIVTREGQVGARFEPDVAPDSPEFEIAIDQALAGKLKLGGKSAPGSGGDAGGGDDDDDGGL